MSRRLAAPVAMGALGFASFLLTLMVVAVLILSIGAARADEPATVMLPTPVASAVAQYLASRPYSEVAPLFSALMPCLALQVPVPNAAALRGDCPAVQAALHPPAPPPPAPPAPPAPHAPAAN